MHNNNTNVTYIHFFHNNIMLKGLYKQREFQGKTFHDYATTVLITVKLVLHTNIQLTHLKA